MPIIPIQRKSRVQAYIENAERKIIAHLGFKVCLIVKLPQEEVNILAIQAYVCNSFKIPWYDIEGRKSDRIISDARKVYCYLCREYTPLTLAAIGNSIHRDHTTVRYSIQKAADLLAVHDEKILPVVNLFSNLIERNPAHEIQITTNA